MDSKMVLGLFVSILSGLVQTLLVSCPADGIIFSPNPITFSGKSRFFTDSSV